MRIPTMKIPTMKIPTHDLTWAFRQVHKHCLQIHVDYTQASRRWIITPTFRTRCLLDGSPINFSSPSVGNNEFIAAVEKGVETFGLSDDKPANTDSDILYDFWYSQTQANKKQEKYNPCSNNRCEIQIDGEWHEYTECIEHGHKPLCLYADLVLLGTFPEWGSHIKINDVIQKD
jgi:hypothetical protein